MTSIIPTAVLRAAVLSAFDRGRYSVTFATTPAGDDLAVVPSAIILNLEEQDDDLLGSEPFELFTEAVEQELRRDVDLAMHGIVSREVAEKLAGMDLSRFYGADDHGPAVPAQDGPRVYEFALHEAQHYDGFTPSELGEVTQNHAPDYVAASTADWVHVYDRVTRERRTLKRPGSDRIVKGLADVAADLRGGPVKGPFRGNEAGTEVFVRSAPIFPMPKPGPLTSAEGLMPGDVLRVIWSAKHGGMGELQDGGIAVLCSANGKKGVFTIHPGLTNERCWDVDRFAFVGRPDADGWMDWPGGENPVGDAVIDVMIRDGKIVTASEASEWLTCWVNDDCPQDIVRFRLVDLPTLPSDT